MADTSLAEVVHGAVSAARVSVPLGALVGVAIGAAAIPGAGPLALAALAGSGALGGFIVGAMTGAIERTRWDRDPAHALEVPPGSSYTLVLVRASPAPARRESLRVRGILARAGALGFLDPAAFYATHPELDARVAVSSAD